MKRIAFLVVFALCIIIIVGLIQSIVTSWRKQDLLASAQTELKGERKKNAELKNQLKKVQNPLFIEEQARNKLFLGKQGEKVVVLSDSLKKVSSSASQVYKEKSAWKQWLAIFKL